MAELVAIMPIPRKPRCVDISSRFGIILGQSSNIELFNKAFRAGESLVADEHDLGYSILSSVIESEDIVANPYRDTVLV